MADAELPPTGMVKVGGIDAAVLLLERFTSAPPGEACPTRYAVPTAEVDPAPEVGFIVKLSRAGSVLTPVAFRI